MHVRTTLAVGFCVCLIGGIWTHLDAQRSGAFRGSTEDPAIKYSSSPLNNVVVDVNRRIQDGSIRLTAEGRSGFLRSALEALQIPVDSQLLVFSRASLQGKLINEQNPRALFFNDRVALGWVRGGEIIEVAAHDEIGRCRVLHARSANRSSHRLTAVQARIRMSGLPRGRRHARCARLSDVQHDASRPVAGFQPAARRRSERRTQSALRRLVRHRKQRVPRRTWVMTSPPSKQATGATAHPSKVCLMPTAIALSRATSSRTWCSLTRSAWPTFSLGPAGRRGRQTPAASAVHGNARRRGTDHGDDERSRQRGRGLPAVHRRSQADRSRAGRVRICRAVLRHRAARQKGRSLHDLDLNRRLMKYPCSYLIYSPAFDALPARAKDPIYRRMWQVLSGEEQGERYRSALSLADRQAIVEILRDTKTDLPAYFQAVTR